MALLCGTGSGLSVGGDTVAAHLQASFLRRQRTVVFMVCGDFVDCQMSLLALTPSRILGTFSITRCKGGVVMSGHLYLWPFIQDKSSNEEGMVILGWSFANSNLSDYCVLKGGTSSLMVHEGKRSHLDGCSQKKPPELISRRWPWETREYLLPSLTLFVPPRRCPSVLSGFTWDANMERLHLLMLLYLA